MTEQTQESLLSRLHRTVIMETATGGLANGLDTVMQGTHGTDVTGLQGANMTDGSALHHGPIEGGAAFDRPSAAYMAHASTHEGVALGPATDNVSSIARDINDAGTLTMDGQTIEVLDYMPGGDMVQMAAGQADPRQMLIKLAQHGIMQEVGARGEQGLSMEEAASGGPKQAYGPVASAEHASSGFGGEAPTDAGHAGPASKAGFSRHVPDIDENARDLEALSVQHRLDVDTAIETSDTSHVHTQLHAHGRTLEIDTDFEATKPSNDEERAEAQEHVAELARGGHDEVNHDEPNMHIRSRIAAHLDAAQRDEGMSM